VFREKKVNSAIRVDGLDKSFGGKQVLFNLGLNVDHGEMVALIGASGSGKSTLLRHLSGLACGDRQTVRSAGSSSIHVLGKAIQEDGKLAGPVRRARSDIGYIFQQFNLVGRLNVLTNVLLGNLGRMPRWRGSMGLFNSEERDRAMDALERVGLGPYAYRRASTLSGGQQQRVAIARTLCQQAEVILADEPIASLDPESARKVMDILADINATDGKTVVVTLHQVDYAVRYCQRVVALKSGHIHYDGPVQALTSQFLNDLYGGDLDMSLLVPAACERDVDARMQLLAA
jgi:phosphonate transport system ATP-binding protein